MLQKIEKWTVLLLILFLPFSWRWVFEREINKFNEWGSAFVYGTDLLIGALLFFLVWRLTRSKEWKKILVLPHLFLLIFVGWSVVSWLKSENLGLGFFRILKLAEFAGLYFYFALSTSPDLRLSRLLPWIIGSGWLQALVGLGQVLKQSSLGWQKLGESVLRLGSSGVATVPLPKGDIFLRAYGLLLHPNLLALWLLLAIFSFYAWYLYRQRPIWLLLVVYFPLLWGFFLTFSRVVVGFWLAGIIIRLVWFLKRRVDLKINPDFYQNLKKLLTVSLAVTLIFLAVFWEPVSARLNWPLNDPAVTERLTYNRLAVQITRSEFLWGVGPGQFVGQLRAHFPGFPDYFYQPVHNIYLLIAGETGIIGLLAFLFWLSYLIYQYCRRGWKRSLPSFSLLVFSVSVLAIGFFDHFLWSIHLGQMTLAIILGILAGRLQTAPLQL